MYVTRPLSLYRKSPEAAFEPPPEGPNSGYLVIFDTESEAEAVCCMGICKDNRIRDFPFPQNKILTVRYVQHHGESTTVQSNKAFFIPVLDQPLSSNLYYVIAAGGKYKGHTNTCSREEDMTPCCFCKCVKDVKPRPFNHGDLYQRVVITQRPRNKFTSKSIAADGFPPSFLRRKGWELFASTLGNYQLSEAHGLDPSLRAHRPNFDFPINSKRTLSTVVGKWYCPFMFIKEMSSLEEQMKKSMFYEMYLEQFWEEIFAHENLGNEGNAVVVKACVPKEAVTLLDEIPVGEGMLVENGMMWFRAVEHGKTGTEVGLSLAIVERMRWEAGRGGWDGGKEKEVTVERVEEFTGGSGWKKFGCYVLVERFVLKRIDGSVVMCYDFKHTHEVRTKWE